MQQKARFSYLFVMALALSLGFASLVAVAKGDNGKDKSGDNGKSNTASLKNFEKADKSKGTTNSQLHKEKSNEVAKNLKEVADDEETAGNTEVSEQIDEVAAEQDQNEEETTEAIAEVEGRGKVKTFLIGTDYKNLGQLRSSLVHNENDIRKLTKSLTQVQTPENQALIEAELATLMQERERIKTVITTNESSFSLFGWVSKFLSGYDSTPIDEQAEEDLATEVEEAIAEAPEATDTTTTPESPAPVPAQ
ncbi:hypothetical protein EPO05_03175 [Patescibacteria group bacterium]|nr:MAG: hypothetical protein EPO05_03175 [Patescibacteria group bacterium]